MFLYAQIDRHFSENPVLEMTIEKLQKIVTANIEAKHKARWLRWWNASSLTVRQSYRFPGSKDKDLFWDSWINKASFWTEVLYYDQQSICLLQLSWFHFILF